MIILDFDLIDLDKSLISLFDQWFLSFKFSPVFLRIFETEMKKKAKRLLKKKKSSKSCPFTQTRYVLKIKTGIEQPIKTRSL